MNKFTLNNLSIIQGNKPTLKKKYLVVCKH